MAVALSVYQFESAYKRMLFLCGSSIPVGTHAPCRSRAGWGAFRVLVACAVTLHRELWQTARFRTSKPKHPRQPNFTQEFSYELAQPLIVTLTIFSF